MKKYDEHILVVEDDTQISNFICYVLKSEGFPYSAVSSAQSAINILITETVDIILLDLGLPDFDGTEVIKKVREWSEIPIIVISARDQDIEKAMTLDIGADDYLTKPFSATELMARIRVALRHLNTQNNKTQQVLISTGTLQIDFGKRVASLDNEEIHLTPMEYNLLSLFFKNIGKVLTTGFIISKIWGAGYGTDTQALRALMASLRRKIEKNPAKPKYIKTEIGIGYRLLDQ